MPTTKHEYLLRGHIRCRRCGRAYVGAIHTNSQNGKWYSQRYYRCMGKLRLYAPLERCNNKGWSAKKLEAMLWTELERYLSNRDLIISEIEKQRQDASQVSVFEAEMESVERQLKVVEREQHQLLQWALKDFPADQVEDENRRLNKSKETLKDQKTDLEAQLKDSQDAVISVPRLEAFIEHIQSHLPLLNFEGKRLALDMLGITVWIDGENVEITGIIEPEAYPLRCTSNRSNVY
ncbi:recombinase zinc beta ribbon domain-containing protein [Chloroflexota bacterium]